MIATSTRSTGTLRTQTPGNFRVGYQSLHEPPGTNIHIFVYIPIHRFSAQKFYSINQILKVFPDLQMFTDA